MSDPRVVTPEEREERLAPLRRQWAERLHLLAACIDSMATAMEDDDGILGSISGQGIANHLSALPRHIRELFLEYASDEAAAGYETDRRYFAAEEVA